jgi:hypothetical protein
MGSSQSISNVETSTSGINLLLEWYNKVQSTDGINGGGQTVTAEDLPKNIEDFTSMKYKIISERNERLIRSIAEKMKLIGFNITLDNKSIEEIIDELMKVLPKPSKQVVANKAAQDDLIGKIFNAFIEVTGLKYTPKDNNDKYVFVTKILYSLFSGLHYEFITAKVGIEQELSKIKLLIDDINNFNVKNYELLTQINDGNTSTEQKDFAKTELQNNIILTKKFLEFFNASAYSLESMLNVDIKPIEQIINNLKTKNDEQSKYLVHFSEVGNLTERGNLIAKNSFGILSDLVNTTNDINKALKIIGVKISEIVNIKNKSELVQLIEDKKLKTPINELGPLARAADVLYSNFAALHDPDIIKKIEGGNSGSESTIDKRIKEFEQNKKLILTQFNQQLDNYFGDLNLILTRLSKRFGTDNGFEINDNLKNFIDAVSAIDSLKVKEIYYAISGYAQDITSVTLREKFVSQLKYILVTVQTLSNGEKEKNNKELLDSLQSCVKKIVEYLQMHFEVFSNKFIINSSSVTGRGFDTNKVDMAIDTANNLIQKGEDIVAKTTEVGERLHDLVKPIADKGYDAINSLINKTKTGGNDDIEGGAMDIARPVIGINKNVFDFENTKELLIRYYKIGKFVHNLEINAKENESYSEQNIKLLGVTIGKRKEKIKYDKKQIIDDLEDVAKSGLDKNSTTINTYGNTDKDTISSLKEWYEKVFQVKENFYNVLEQIELILNNFINAISKNPKSVNDIRSIIDNVMTTSHVFDEKLGNDLCKLFELFPYNDTFLNNDLNALKDIESDHYYEIIKDIINAGKFAGNPYYGLDITNKDRMNEFMKQVKNLSSEMNIVTNILSMFRKIGEKIGDQNTLVDLSLSMTTMSNYIKDFLVVSTFINNFTTYKATSNIVGYSSASLTGEVGPDLGGRPELKNKSKILFNSVDPIVNADLGGKVNFNEELELFEMLVKAMIAKIFTTIGVYNIFERPLNIKYSKATSPTRLILGGFMEYPDIVPGLIDTYSRLLLFSEFYREIFDVDKVTTGNTAISFVPDIDGVFSKIIELIFIKFNYIKDGNYSESDIKQYIEEVNNIYILYSNKDKNVNPRTIIEDFAIEINRRYGVVKGDEFEKIKELRNLQSSFGTQLNYDAMIQQRVLEDDDDMYTSRKLAPSSLYYSGLMTTDFKISNIEDVDLKKNMAIFGEFRKKLDKELQSFVTNDKFDQTVSFDKAISQAKNDVNNTSTNNEDKFKIVYNLLTSSDKYSKTNDNRQIMFHEIIIMPLTLLNMVRLYLETFKANLETKFTAIGAAKLTSQEIITTIRDILNMCVPIDNIVDLKITNNSIYFDMSNIKSLVKQVVSQIKIDINKFKGIIDDKKYDDISKEILNLEDKFLMEELLGAKNGTDSFEKIINASLSEIIHSNANSIKNTLSTTVDSAIDTIVIVGKPDDIPAETLSKVYNDTVAKTILTVTAANAVVLGEDNSQVRLVQFYTNMTDTKYLGFAARNRDHMGFVNVFNQLLFRYMDVFFDGQTIYSNLINGFANGTFSSEIMGTKHIDDFGVATTASGDLAIIDDTKVNIVIMYTSIALILKSLVTTTVNTNNNTVKKYLTNDINDVPLYMKERYRVYLPQFSKVFELKIKQLEQFKKLLKLLNSAGGNGVSINESNASEKLCDKLIQAYYSLKSCINEVMRELDDKPKYLELYKDSIIDYRNINKKLPFMPLSLELAVHTIGEYILPNKSINPDTFKLLYGTRQLFNLSNLSTLTYENIPGFRNILDSYNSSVDSRSSFDQEYMLKYIQQIQTINNYMLNVQYSNIVEKIDGYATKFKLSTDNKFNKLYSFKTDLSKLINIVESSFQDDKKNEMINSISGTGTLNSRSDMRVMNILDMGIMPININALRRSIPLINIMNLAYSFDQMVGELFEIDDVNKLTTNKGTFENVKSVKDFFVKLLINPRDIINQYDYDNYAGKFFRGDLGLPLVRGKLIPDQIFNKSLFGELYESENVQTSPATTSSNQRGELGLGLKNNLKNFVLTLIIDTTELICGIGTTNNKDYLAVYSDKDGRKNMEALISQIYNTYINESDYKNIQTKLRQIDKKYTHNDNANRDRVSFISTLGFICYKRILKQLEGLKIEDIKDVNKLGNLSSSFEDILKLYLGNNLDLNGFVAPQTENTIGADGYVGPNAAKIKIFNNVPTDIDGIKIYTTLGVNNNVTRDTSINALVTTTITRIATFIKLYDKSDLKLSNKINYPVKDNNGGVIVKSVDVKEKHRGLWEVGKMRFDTPLIRNIIFLSNINRVIRYKLDSELKWYNKNDIVKSFSALSDDLTEEYGNNL